MFDDDVGGYIYLTLTGIPNTYSCISNTYHGISPVVRHPKIIAKTQISRPRPPRDPGRGPVMPTGCAHRVIVSAFGDSRAAGRTGHGRRREGLEEQPLRQPRLLKRRQSKRLLVRYN